MTTHWKLLCFGLAVIACGTAQAKDAGRVWQGSLGPNEVVVEIKSPARGSADLEGRYFYHRHRLDIQLHGKASADGRIALQEGRGDGDDAPRSEWKMQMPAQDRWDGEWIGPKGKRLPIHLRGLASSTPVTARDPGLEALRGDIDNYELMRMADLTLQKKKLQQVDGYTLQWLHQPESKVDLFEVVSGYPQAQLQRINRTLHKSLWNEVAGYFDCMSSARDGLGDYQTTTTLRHISPRILSVSLESSWYCGGAHPDFGDSPLNIDPRDGRDLDLEDVLWLGSGKALHQVKDNYDDRAWPDYRSKLFAPWAVKQLKSLYPDEFKVGEDECNYDDPELWQFTSWYATSKGIHISAYFPRVARPCDNPDWAILPWKAVDAHPGAVRIH
ncbi:MAG: hypothetical protein JSR70_02200 [Proteobacteria bacterium]|nr:hypothetical protein [Pseudomonadota bacterium]